MSAEKKTEITPVLTKSGSPPELRLILDHGSAPRMPYHPRERSEKLFTVHHGQRKLFLALLDFLNETVQRTGKRNGVFLYVGAAPGTNIAWIAKHFYPEFDYHLYDPAPFAKACSDRKNIFVYNELFTDKACTEWAKKFDGSTPHANPSDGPASASRVPHIFMSDIRYNESTAKGKFHHTDKPAEEADDDMILQDGWVRKLKPDLASLKFRCPWIPGTIKYLDGEIHLQAYAPLSSTEARLIVDDPTSFTTYDNKTYEDEMFYFNSIDRSAKQFAPVMAGIQLPSLDEFPEVQTQTHRDAGAYERLHEYVVLYRYWKLYGLDDAMAKKYAFKNIAQMNKTLGVTPRK